MQKIAIAFALHGALVLTLSMIAGLLLHLSIRRQQDGSGWHLAHAGGSGRGVTLIALAGVVRWVALPEPQLRLFAWLLLFFVWTSMAAMMLGAASGERGQRWRGSVANRLVYALYVVGAIAVFPAAALLIAGLFRAL